MTSFRFRLISNETRDTWFSIDLWYTEVMGERETLEYNENTEMSSEIFGLGGDLNFSDFKKEILSSY